MKTNTNIGGQMKNTLINIDDLAGIVFNLDPTRSENYIRVLKNLQEDLNFEFRAINERKVVVLGELAVVTKIMEEFFIRNMEPKSSWIPRKNIEMAVKILKEGK
jgi:hypothetical protein